MFSKSYDEFGKFVEDEEPIFAIGNLESSGDAVKMQVNKVIPMKKIANELTESLRLQISKTKIKPDNLIELKKIINGSEGNIPVFINLTENGTDKGKLFSLTDLRVKITSELLKALVDLLGEESIKLNPK